MRAGRRLAALAVFYASPAAAAAGDHLAGQLRLLQSWDDRLATVAWRLTTANRDRCKDLAPQPGIVFYEPGEFGGGARATARALFNLGSGPAVAAVVPQSAAAKAGLAAGDELVAIDGALPVTVATGETASFAGLAALLGQLDTAYAKGETTLTVRRADGVRVIRFTPDRGCPTYAQIKIDPARDATADGKTISINTGILRYMQSDDDLAVIVGHELAHNVLGHRALRQSENISTGLFAGIGANGAKLRAIEDAADATGVALMARAGYDPADAARFWNRFGPKTDPIIGDGTHRGWRGRVERLRAAAAGLTTAGPAVAGPKRGDD